MYTEFYNFSEKPFNITPDPKFLFLTSGHREALASLLYGIIERKGFISLTGEVGTGKTTLVYSLLSNLTNTTKTVFVYHTNTTFEQLLKNILLKLDIEAGDEDKSLLLYKLNNYVASRLSPEQTFAIIIDEAQNLSSEILEELRMLSNMETCKSKMIQIVLVGQPELENKLNAEKLRQLKQRIGIRRHCKPLTPEESRQYIEHRLKLVGSGSSQVFTSNAISRICRYAHGIPRTINVICDNAFLIGYSESKDKIDAKIIEEVIADMDGSAWGPVEIDSIPMYTAPEVLTEKKVIPRYNKVTVPLLLFIGIAVLLILGMGYLENWYSSTRNVSQVPFSIEKELLPQEDTENHEILAYMESEQFKPDVQAPVEPAEEPEPAGLAIEKELVPAEYTSRSASLTEAKEFITVEPGSCVFSLAREYYHIVNGTLIDMILQANPDIVDANEIRVNQKIKIPEITDESLVIALPDGTFNIHLGTFPYPNYAKLYSKEVSILNKQIEIIPRKISKNEIRYKIVMGSFDNRENCLHTVKMLKQKGLLPIFEVVEKRKKGQVSAGFDAGFWILDA